MTQVDIYIKVKWTGSMRGTGRAAGIIVCTDREGKEHHKVVTTNVQDSTRERLQLQAITKALHSLNRPCSVGIYVNNEHIRNVQDHKWYRDWQKNGWKNKRGKEIKNGDVWRILAPLLETHEVGIMGYIGRYEPELEKALEE